MEKEYRSLKELMSSCGNSKLKWSVSSVLRNKPIPWSFVSASVDGDICRSEFSSQIEGTNVEYHLSCQIIPGRESRYSCVCDSGTIPVIPYGVF